MSGSKTSGVAIIVILLLIFIPVVNADERFTDNGDGTVTDHYMGLMWAKSDNQGKINWKQAVKWVTYTLPMTIQTSYDNWRLPTIGELRTLYIKDKNAQTTETDCGMRVKVVKAIELSCGWVWSGQNKDISATVFSFKDGYHFPDLMMHNKVHRALAVRSIQ